MKQFIRRDQKVTLCQWEVFSQFPLVLAKNKDSFSGMFDTINYYLINGKADFQGAQRAQITTIARMAETTLFTQ